MEFSQIYLHPSVLKGCCSEDIIMVVLWQMVQEISHLLFSFEGSHFGSYHNWFFLTYVNQSSNFSKPFVMQHGFKIS